MAGGWGDGHGMGARTGRREFVRYSRFLPEFGDYIQSSHQVVRQTATDQAYSKSSTSVLVSMGPELSDPSARRCH